MSIGSTLDPSQPDHPEFLKHTDAIICPLCTEKLKSSHLRMREWFEWVKKTRPIAHVSWAFRNEVEQNAMVAAGKSREPWPKSMHNKTLPDGTPNSYALDLFVIDEDGIGRFPPKFYFLLNQENKANQFPIDWSGAWKTFKESDHFQLSQAFIQTQLNLKLG